MLALIPAQLAKLAARSRGAAGAPAAAPASAGCSGSSVSCTQGLKAPAAQHTAVPLQRQMDGCRSPIDPASPLSRLSVCASGDAQCRPARHRGATTPRVA